MSTGESVSRWIEELKRGDETAAAEVWNNYFARLTALARHKLRGAPRRAADEEDVVAGAFETFFRRAQKGQFPQLKDRQDLWHLLVKITERKAYNQRRDQRRAKRGGGRLRGESVLEGNDGPAERGGLDQVAGGEPTPEFAAMIAEALDELLGVLDPELQTIALLKLEGHTNAEIAAKTGRSVPTVERRLRMIRSTWKREPP
jgi:DNA-directed RNA polymerase specialized sigma24 family protein